MCERRQEDGKTGAKIEEESRRVGLGESSAAAQTETTADEIAGKSYPQAEALADDVQEQWSVIESCWRTTHRPNGKRLLEEIAASHELVLDQPEPLVEVHELKDSSVDFIVRPWVKTEHYWKVYWDITHQVTTCYDQKKLSVPYPRRDVLVREGPTAA